jgi:hypothetical protein
MAPAAPAVARPLLALLLLLSFARGSSQPSAMKKATAAPVFEVRLGRRKVKPVERAAGFFPSWLSSSDEGIQNEGDLQYFGTIFVGETGNPVTVVFDTGSSDLWVPQENVDPEKCSSKTAAIQYSRGSVAGPLCWASLTIGGTAQEPGAVFQEQVMLLVPQAAVKDLGNTYFDGVLGLAFPDLSHTNAGGMTVVQTMVQKNKIDVFCFLLTGDENEEGSKLVLGMPKEEWVNESSLLYTPVVVQEWWTMSLAIAIGSTLLIEDSYAALDTGTSFISFPTYVYNAFLEQLIPDATDRAKCSAGTIGGCPCNLRQSAKVVYLVVGGRDFPIYPEDIFLEYTSELCTVEVQEMKSQTMPIIVGDTFLRTIAAVFDAGTSPRMGLARRPDHIPTKETVAKLRDDVAQTRSTRAQISPYRPDIGPRWNPPMWLAVLGGVCVGVFVGWLAGTLIGKICDRRAARKLRADGAGTARLLGREASSEPGAPYVLL